MSTFNQDDPAMTFVLSIDRLLGVAAPKPISRTKPLPPSTEVRLGPVSPWFSIDDAAAYLSVSRSTIDRAIADRRLQTAELGRRVLIHRDSLDQAMQRPNFARRQTSQIIDLVDESRASDETGLPD